ncbi:MAG: FAD-dependent oxidoreductase [Planctomycetota bacterium]
MDPQFLTTPRHAVAVIGGACSGAECAEILAQSGCYVVVIDQNARPFGKIEDGLPRWHAKQRSQEYVKIAAKLAKPGVDFLPKTAIGRDLTLGDLRSWGFSAVVLACGAWRDRPVGVPGADQAVGKGLVYQNPFIYWFNHHEEKTYDGARYRPVDGAVVIGGGLASIDCVKALMLETVAEKLRARGDHHVDVLHMEHEGVAKSLQSRNLTLGDLGLKGCTLLYRRSAREMPIAAFKDGADEASRQNTMNVREKLMKIVQDKFLCGFRGNVVPKEIVTGPDGNVCGLRVVQSRTEGKKVVEVPGTEEVIPTTMIVSSIGSIPEPIPGLPVKGEFYDFADWDLGRFTGMPELFGVGNVVTGQGNIAISRRHAKVVSDAMVARYLGVGDDPLDGRFDGSVGAPAAAEARGADAAEAVQNHIAKLAPLPPSKLADLRGRIAARQRELGYGGDLAAWIASVTPPDRI